MGKQCVGLKLNASCRSEMDGFFVAVVRDMLALALEGILVLISESVQMIFVRVADPSKDTQRIPNILLKKAPTDKFCKCLF